MRILLTISYLGTGFKGYQRQPDKITVQGELESALQLLYLQKVQSTASGRTDEGVHAIAQAVHFDSPKNIPLNNVIKGLNCFLPPQIRVTQAREVAEDFNARMNAKKKTYIYRFYFSRLSDPFLEGRAMKLNPDTDCEIMARAAELFVGTHDFNAFRCVGSSAKTTVRTVYDCSFIREGNFATLTVSANGFLYKMVRLLAGTLILAAEGKMTLQRISQLLESGGENARKVPAESGGLYLASVEY